MGLKMTQWRVETCCPDNIRFYCWAWKWSNEGSKHVAVTIYDFIVGSEDDPMKDRNMLPWQYTILLLDLKMTQWRIETCCPDIIRFYCWTWRWPNEGSKHVALTIYDFIVGPEDDPMKGRNMLPWQYTILLLDLKMTQWSVETCCPDNIDFIVYINKLLCRGWPLVYVYMRILYFLLLALTANYVAVKV